MKRWPRIGLVLFILFVLVAGVTRPAQAAVIDDDGRIEANEVIEDDVFLSGDTVIVDGTVNGLLMAAGETVTINGTVNGDLFAGGNHVFISPEAQVNGNIFLGARTAVMAGQVSGSLFGGAASTVMDESAVIGNNLYYGGYNFEMEPGASVARDLAVGGYQAALNGVVKRDVFFGGQSLTITGEVGRDVKVEVGSGDLTFYPTAFGMEDLPAPMTPGLRVDESAKIGSQIIYRSQQPQDGTIKVSPSGGIIYQTPVPVEVQPEPKPSPITVITKNPAVEWLLGFVRNAVTLLALGALALWLIPKVFARTVQQAQNVPGYAAGYGLLAIFSGYFSSMVAVALILLVGIMLTLLSLGGLATPVFGVGFSALALFMSIFTLLISTGSKLVVAYLVGQLLVDRIAPTSTNRPFWSLASGVVIYALVRSIPIIGWLFGLAATLVGVGAMWLAYQAWRKQSVAFKALPSEA